MNKVDAAAAIGISVRSLQRDTQNKLIDATYRNVKGKMTLDYSDEEVERWKQQRRRIIPESIATAAIATRDNNGAMATERMDDFLHKLEETILNGFVEGRNYLESGKRSSDGKAQVVDLKDKLILSLPEAVKLSGIPRERLRTALLPDGTVLCFKDDVRLGRGYKIRKMDLQEYIHALDLPELEQHEK